MMSLHFVKRLQGSEEGSALILAMVVMVVISIFLASMLAFVDTNLLASGNLEEVRKIQYSADAAMEMAIAGTDPDTCADPAPVTINGYTADVGGPTPGSSPLCVAGGGSDNASNTPPGAIITMSTSTVNDGDGFLQGSNALLSIRGPVFSNSTVRVSASQAKLDVSGTVSALGTCTDLDKIVSSSPPLRCSNTTGTAVPAEGSDPAILSPAAWASSAPASFSSLVLRDEGYIRGKCTAPFQTIEFDPGYYNDADALSDVMSATGSCPGSTFRFKPSGASVGVYYFDFRDTGNISCGGSSRPHQWCVDDANAIIVGGTPWTGFPLIPPAPGGRCRKTEPGIQFIFGGDSHLNIQSGAVELCANPFTDQQQIAVYGQKTTDAVPAPVPTPPQTVTVTARTVSNVNQFNDPNNARLIDNLSASAPTTPDPPSSETAKLLLENFGPLPFFPTGTVSNVKLRVKHQDIDNVKALSMKISRGGTGGPGTKTYNAGTCVANDSVFCIKAGAAHQEEIDVTEFLGDRADGSRFQGLTIEFEATGDKTTGRNAALLKWNEKLDGIELVVTYDPPDPVSDPDPPRYRAQSGCILTAYSTSGSCAFIRTDGAQSGLVIHGTVYSPSAVVDINLTNVTTQILERGVIARSLKLSLTPSVACLVAGCPPTVQIPAVSAGGASRVLFVARVTEGGSPRVRLKAVVEYPSTGPPTKVDWQVVR